MRDSAPACTDLAEMVAFALMQYRFTPHDATGESPAYMMYGFNPVLRVTDVENCELRLSPQERTRLEVIAEFRQALVQNYQQLMQNLDKPSEITRVFKHGDIVIVYLSELQAREYAASVGCSVKLVPDWSLPMRVILVSGEGTTATLQCIISGVATRAHLDRVRFVRKPQTAAMLKDWERIMRADIGHFHEGFAIEEVESDSDQPIDGGGKTESKTACDQLTAPVQAPEEGEVDTPLVPPVPTVPKRKSKTHDKPKPKETSAKVIHKREKDAPTYETRAHRRRQAWKEEVWGVGNEDPEEDQEE